jgi:hypothetical protein
MPDYRTINFNQLSKADIIFTTARNSLISQTIRKATDSIISHTMFVADGIYIIDSTDTHDIKGVAKRPWQDAKEGCTLAIVMRRHSLLNLADQNKVVEAAQSFNGRPYDKLGAAGSGMMGSSRNMILAGAGCTLSIMACGFLLTQIAENAKDENADKAFFCSELVARAFSVAGFPIVNGKATNMIPQMVFTSSALSYVGHLIDEPEPSPNLTKEQLERNRRSGYRKDN